MKENLDTIAPMHKGDACLPLQQTIQNAYKSWPNQYNNRTKILRGVKCPKQITSLNAFSQYIPKTLIIVGIRHPILFFQSFWNMMLDSNSSRIRGKTPYDFMNHCKEKQRGCNSECPIPGLICLHRTRFHLHLARIGKTSLNHTERELLAPDDKDGGIKLTNRHIRNPIFLYEQHQLNQNNTWVELARTLKVPYINHDIHANDNTKRKKISRKRINICDAQYDDFRSRIMPHAYNMSKWLCDYLVPVAMDENRDDVIIPDAENFCTSVKSYKDDPCNRLVRVDDGRYILGENIASNINSSSFYF